MDHKKKDVELFLERLQYLLEYKDMKKKDLALLSGIDSTTISRWNNASDIPSEGSISKICRAVGCSFDWLATGEGPMFRYQPQPGDQVSLATGMRTEEPSGAGPDHETLNVDEALAMTKYVLESDTVYRGALLSSRRSSVRITPPRPDINHLHLVSHPVYQLSVATNSNITDGTRSISPRMPTAPGDSPTLTPAAARGTADHMQACGLQLHQGTAQHPGAWGTPTSPPDHEGSAQRIEKKITMH